MSTFLPPFYRAIDEDGAPISGARLYFYQTGTTTPLATYSNEALTSANAQPVAADTDGWFGRIYLKTDQEYRVVLTESDDTVIWTADHVDAIQLSGTTLATRVAQMMVNPLDYGAVGDGVADDDDALQDAIDAAGSVVDLAGKTYRVDSGLVLKSNLTLRNGGLDFSQAASPANNCLTIQGSHGTPVSLSSNAAFDAASIVLASVAGLSAGDWLYVYSSAAWSGELAQIDSIVGTTVALRQRLLAAYNTVDSAAARKLTTVKNVTLENIRIATNSAGSGTGRVVWADVTENFVARNVTVDGAKLGGFVLDSCIRARLENCLVSDDDADTGAGFIVGNHSYDVSLDRCPTRSLPCGIVLNDDAGGLLGGPAGIGGITQGVRIEGCKIDRPNGGVGGYGIVTGVPGTDTLIVDVEIADNRISSSGTVTYGIYYSGHGLTLRGNNVRNAIVEVRLATAASALTDHLHSVISENTVHDAAFTITGSSGARAGLTIQGNRVYSDDFTINTNNADATIVGNKIHTGRLIVTIAKGAVVGNVITSASGAAALTVTGSLSPALVAVSGNVAHCTNNRAASFTGLDASAITGNVFTRDDDAASCVLLTNCDDFTVDGGAINNGTYGLEFVTSTGGLHDGNVFLGQATGTTTGAGVTAGDSA